METLARKLIARAAGQPGVSAGDVVICKVDLAMIHDSGGPRRVKPMLERLGPVSYTHLTLPTICSV